MKICGILPLFNGEDWRYKTLEMFKLLILLIPLVYTAGTNLAFGIVHFNDITRMAAAGYIFTGYLIGITMHIWFCVNAESVQELLTNMTALINKRKFHFEWGIKFCN